MLTPRENSPLPKKKSSLEEDRTHDAASSRTVSPTHYQLSYSGPTETDERGRTAKVCGSRERRRGVVSTCF